jgi:hypothetical protein
MEAEDWLKEVEKELVIGQCPDKMCSSSHDRNHNQ